MITVSRLLCAF